VPGTLSGDRDVVQYSFSKMKEKKLGTDPGAFCEHLLFHLRELFGTAVELIGVNQGIFSS
jgi:hypothetical protein